MFFDMNQMLCIMLTKIFLLLSSLMMGMCRFALETNLEYKTDMSPSRQ